MMKREMTYEASLNDYERNLFGNTNHSNGVMGHQRNVADNKRPMAWHNEEYYIILANWREEMK